MPIESRCWQQLGLAVLGLVLAVHCSPTRAETPRAITLAPHLTELAYAVEGENALVGVVAWSDYPEAAKDLPRIGDAFQFNLERITMLAPTVALAWRGGTNPALAQRLQSMDIDVVWIQIRSLDDIAQALTDVGTALGQAASGAQAAAQFRSALANRPPIPKNQRRPAFYQISEQPLFTLGKRHILSELLHRCGAYNVFDDLDVEAAAVEFEAVIARQPEIIIAGRQFPTHDALAHWRQFRELLPDHTRFIEVDPDTLIRPTPRIVQGMDQLCQKLK
ncbi:MAG: helical backbone metal receptor [Wenzhouxiangella sp.]|jgi:iron complex transport system substrate-binding protein|nr:helical backbone metal receptor [Wenzhouxiangella sp.]